MHTLGKWAGAGMIALLAGCSSMPSLNPMNWSINPFADKPKNPPSPLVEFRQTLAVSKAWSISLGNSGAAIFTPAHAGDSVYAASADGVLMRVDAASGRVQWRVSTGARLSAGVGTDGQLVAVASEDGTVLAYSADGKLLWKAQTSSEVLSAPAVGAGAVVVRSVDNRIVALDAVNGDRRWTQARPAPALVLRTAPGIVIANETAYLAMPGGKLLALALNNGGARWESVVGEPRGATELERLVDVAGFPVLTGSEICAVAYHGRVACFDAATGAGRWARDISSDAGIAVDERFVFVADEHGAVNAYAREAGQSVWRNDKMAYRRLSAPASIGRAVAVGDYQGQLHFLSREDGALLARVATDGSPVRAVPIVAADRVVFQTQAGTLVALSTQ